MSRNRQSNIELLRIVSMLFVLILHADYVVFGYPKVNGVQAHPDIWSLRIFIEQMAIGAVDLFVLISGWFGIRSSLKGGLLYLFQIFFTATVILLGFWLYSGCAPIPFDDIVSSYEGFWFVWAYLILYVISPVLNAFVEKATRREMEWLLLAVFLMDFVNVFTKIPSDFNFGYSSLHFIAIYLLARYLRLYNPLASLCRRQLLGGYLAATALCTGIIFAAAMWWGNPWLNNLEQQLTVYNSPLVVLAAVFLLLYFSKLQFQNRIVNWLAAGSFNVYLVHQNLFLRDHYREMIRNIDNEVIFPASVAVIFAFICTVFLGSVILDQPRQWIANYIRKKF